MPESFVLTDAMRQRLTMTHPGRIPIFVMRAPSCSGDIPDLPRKKFLVNGDLTIGQFLYVIRRQLVLKPEQALFLFVENSLPVSTHMLREVHAQYASSDGALRLTYTSESAFG